jgi:glycosyltransferase involved in cell wall biosynthesis
MGPCFGTILRRIKRNKHSRIVSIIDNIIPHEKRVGDKPFAKYFVKAVDAFIVMSKSVEEDMKKFVGPNQPVRFIPHPIYDNYGLPVSQEESRKKLQGLDLLLEAMADERVRKMGIKAIVAGEYYSDSKPYEEQIERLGIKDLLVLHTDFIPNSEVAPFFGAADMVVQPYKTATQSGISQMAYHFEKPMLVTNVGGLPEIVPNGKAGYVTEVDAKAIADAIVDFYENNRVASFQSFVKEEKKKFAWETMVDGIKDISGVQK